MNRRRDILDALAFFCALTLPIVYVGSVLGSFIFAAVMIAKGTP